MRKRILCSAAALLFAGSVALFGQSEKAKSYSGMITDTMCGASHGDGTDPVQCTKTCVKEHGAKLALYDTTSKKVYVLDPQSKGTGHEGKPVSITGTLDPDGKTLHVASLKEKASKAAGL